MNVGTYGLVAANLAKSVDQAEQHQYELFLLRLHFRSRLTMRTDAAHERCDEPIQMGIQQVGLLLVLLQL